MKVINVITPNINWERYGQSFPKDINHPLRQLNEKGYEAALFLKTLTDENNLFDALRKKWELFHHLHYSFLVHDYPEALWLGSLAVSNIQNNTVLVSGSLSEFHNFICTCSKEYMAYKVRLLANSFMFYFRENGFAILYENLTELKDKTFELRC